MATHVNTVLGPLAVEDLGRTLVHEHVLIGFPGWFMDARQPTFKRSEAMKRVVDAFQELHGHGVRTVIDPCPMDLGRDVEFTAEVSQKSGINLICATGCYVEDMGIPWTMNQLPIEAVTEIFIKEIEEGVGDTGIRCGVIKIATGLDKVTDYERKVLHAAARASKATGVPLISHTEQCTCGHNQIDIALSEGLAPTGIIVGHSDGTEDLAYQTSLAERGVYVGFDRFGLSMGAVPDEIRIRNLMALANAGYRDQLMVSHDAVNCWLGAYGASDPLELNKIMPNWKMTHLFENIFPELKKAGMTDEQFNGIVTDNPRRYFEAAHKH